MILDHPAPAAEAEPGRLRLPRPAPPVLWWTTPVGGLVLLTPLTLVVAVLLSESDYRTLYRTPKYLTVGEALIFAAMAMTLAIGTLIPRLVERSEPVPLRDSDDAPRWRVFAIAELVAFRITVTGYLLFGLIGAARGARPGDVITSVLTQSNDSNQLTDLFAPVAGVTSLTQVGIAQAVLAAVLLTRGRDRAVLRRTATVLVLALVRTYVLTERLALIELLVPLLVVGAATAYRRGRAVRWLRAAPVVALPVLTVFFGAFEYSRSWTFYRATTTLSFPDFVVRRLAGYYATAYNNGAIQLQHPPAGGVPYNSLQLVWTAPGAAQLDLYGRLGGNGGPDWLVDVVDRYGNPEFNNPGGLAVPVLDFGVYGGALFFLIIGLIVGLAYHSWRLDRTFGLLFYPPLFTGLLEVPRYVLWTEGRVFPAFVFLAATAGFAARATARGRPARGNVVIISPR